MKRIFKATWMSVLVASISISGCEQKKVDQPSAPNPDDTIFVNAKTAPTVYVEHKGDTKIGVDYEDGLLHYIRYYTGKSNTANIVMSDDGHKYPSRLTNYDITKNKTTYRQVYFNADNGAVSRIGSTLAGNNNNDGPYYMFQKNGTLVLSGFYNDGKCVGIWRQYDLKGNIIKTLNADKVDIDVPKKWGFVL